MSNRLRIAQVAPIAGPITADATGSIDQLVWLLTEDLVSRGHDVTLFATGDSQTSARLHATYPRGYEAEDGLWNWEFHETLHVAAACEAAQDFDVIHSHVYHYALPFTRLIRTPMVHSYHILPDDDVVAAYGRYPEAHVVAISDYQRRVFRANRDVAVVHHGINTDAFPFNKRPGDYFVFLGRMVPGKGVAEAIHLAEQAGERLVIAGPRDDNDEGYFASEVAPLLGRSHVEYIGPVGPARRNELLSNAAGLIYPITEPEPFGLVIIESMACGTPVVATDLGAVPELIELGVTGWYAPTWQDLVPRLQAARGLDREQVRRSAIERFDYRRMVDEYLAVYRRLAATRRWRVAQ